MQPLDCARVCADLSAFLDGELDTLHAEAVHAHFAMCTACEQLYIALREQLVEFQWAGVAFVFEPPESALFPELEALQHRLSCADLTQLGRTLYEILKAQFLHLYGEGLEPDAAPVGDLEAHRQRGVDLVEALRDWHDGDRVDDVELLDVRERMQRPSVAVDPVQLFIDGMIEVGRMTPDLENATIYWQAIAHIKARRQAQATTLFEVVAALEGEPLARSARICLATLPVLFGQGAAEVIERLNRCLEEDPTHPIVLFNLAKAHFLHDGVVEGAGAVALEQACRVAPELVSRQFARPSERAFRAAAQSSGISIS